MILLACIVIIGVGIFMVIYSQFNHLITLFEITKPSKQVKIQSDVYHFDTQDVKALLKPDCFRTYDFWVRGIGNEFMWNNDSDSTCLFKPNDILVDEMIAYQHGDVLNAKHDKNTKAFSSILGRMVTVDCQKNKWKYFQSPLVHHEKDKIMDESKTKWISVKSNRHILHLDKLTQATWIKCGSEIDFHFSLLPLSKTNKSMYQHKKRLIKQNFGSQRLPNIVLFVMDSISRPGFHRGCPDTMNLLSEMKLDRNGQTKSEIFEFHRYSTISWATHQNMGGLIRGNCATFVDGCPEKQHNITLFEYYDTMGFNVFGWSKSNDTKNDFVWHFEINNGDPVIGVQFIKQALKQQSKDDGVPYFIIIHEASNHVSNSQGIYATDEVIHELLEAIDYDNTMLNLLGDHGNLIGNGLQTFYGGWEMNNPPNIMLMPKWFAKDIDTTALKINEQRFFSHYDNHRLYKEILWKLCKNNDVKALYKTMIEQTLPIVDGVSVSMDILNEVIAVDRKCDGILPGWCVCHTLQKKELTEELINDDGKYLQQIIDAINEVTGDGKWGCKKLNVANFEITKHFEDEMMVEEQASMKLTIQEIISNQEEREILVKENRLLTYEATFNHNAKSKTKTYKLSKIKEKDYAIQRIDWFKFERCIKLHSYPNQQLGSGIEFTNRTFNRAMLLSGVGDRVVYNLRLCKCK